MSEIKERIESILKDNWNEFLKIRRHIHQYPELSFQEFETQKFIMDQLSRWGIDHHPIAETGVMAVIKGKNPEKKLIILRGDIDALPITENTGLDFASKNDGVMHACGHDVHTTCVLAAGKILNELSEDFEGTVKLLFQPGEEKLPGGATMVIASGELDDPVPDAILGQHVFAELEAGKLGFRQGLYMASADEIYIDVKGPGGHAAMPEKTVDTLHLASKLIVALKAIVENRTNDIPTVLTFGKIEGKGATNVIPKLVHMEGTFRTMDEKWRMEVHAEMQKVVDQLVSGTKAEVDLDIRKGYPCLINNDELAASSKNLAQAYLGNENVIDLDIRMTAEDFSFYSQKYKANFYRLGIKSPGKEVTNLHSPEFTVDEKALETGSGFMAFLALSYLG